MVFSSKIQGLNHGAPLLGLAKSIFINSESVEIFSGDTRNGTHVDFNMRSAVFPHASTRLQNLLWLAVQRMKIINCSSNCTSREDKNGQPNAYLKIILTLTLILIKVGSLWDLKSGSCI